MSTDQTLVRQPPENTGSLPQLPGDDNPTTRRMLLTGGAVTAGAAVAALASTAAEAAPVYLQIGVSNTSGGPTRLTTSASTAFIAITSAASGSSIQGYTNASGAIGVLGTSTTGSAGVKGVAPNGSGLLGSGVYGGNCTGTYSGVYASGANYGGIFYGNDSGSYAVYANGQYLGAYGAGGTYGLYGSGATGVYGTGTTGVNGHGTSTGVYGTASSGSGKAVHGSGGQYGVHGDGGGTAGVRGDSGYVGVWGQAPTYALYALSTDTTNQCFGIFGECQTSNPNAFGVYSKGNAHVAGTLSKSAGSFKIDHPLDPERKWLQHSFVESPDMMNVYNGNVTTDASGNATVTLPDYFTALNRDFRYQLTVVGKLGYAAVEQEIATNQFRIRSSEGNTKVSWQVTGIRQDDYAKTHPIVVELAKTKDQAGTRAFVAPGVSARQMQVGPTAATIKQ